MEIWVAIIGGLLGLFSIAISNFFSHRSKLKFEKQKLKEEYYKLWLEALSDNVNSKDENKARRNLPYAENRLLLVASVEVIRAIEEFRKYRNQGAPTPNPTKEHNETLTKVLIAMRKDLYGKNINKNYPIVGIRGTFD